jgi:ankyrin repeat protein
MATNYDYFLDDVYGAVPDLCRASHFGNFELVQTLLETGVDIEECDKFGQTALFYAVLSYNTDICILLLKNGANIEHIDDFEQTCLYYAAGDANSKAFNILLEYGAELQTTNIRGCSPLGNAVRCCCIDYIRILLDRGVDVNCKNETGSNILLYLSKEDSNDEILLLLIEHGVDVNSVDHQGDTPLIIASMKNSISSLKILLNAGAVPYHENAEGETFLNNITQLEQIEMKIFIKDNIIVNYKPAKNN